MQILLLYLWDSLVTLELISLIPLAGSPEMDPLAVKLLDNRLSIHLKQSNQNYNFFEKMISVAQSLKQRQYAESLA